MVPAGNRGTVQRTGECQIVLPVLRPGGAEAGQASAKASVVRGVERAEPQHVAVCRPCSRGGCQQPVLPLTDHHRRTDRQARPKLHAALTAGKEPGRKRNAGAGIVVDAQRIPENPGDIPSREPGPVRADRTVRDFKPGAEPVPQDEPFGRRGVRAETHGSARQRILDPGDPLRHQDDGVVAVPAKVPRTRPGPFPELPPAGKAAGQAGTRTEPVPRFPSVGHIV